MGILSGKTVLLTGATRGIGRAMASCFAKEGAELAFTYLNSDEKCKSLENELRSLGVKAKGYKSDASDFAQTGQTVQKVVNDFGKIDILVNNAGITKDGLVFRISEESWDEVIDSNLKSAFNYIHACVPLMLKQRSGNILSVSSIVGMHGNPGQCNYAASKAGIIGLTKSLAKEIGSRNIRVNAIAPGFVLTEMTSKMDEETLRKWCQDIPMQRGGTPEEIAQSALFLISDMSSYVTGHILQVDGGRCI